jgi:hypothetical protein
MDRGFLLEHYLLIGEAYPIVGWQWAVELTPISHSCHVLCRSVPQRGSRGRGVAAALEYEIQPPNMQAPTPKTPHKEDLRSEHLISMQYGQSERRA